MTSSAVGIACAVRTSTANDWGHSIHCYQAVGSSGEARTLLGGIEGGGNSPFQGGDPNKRIVALAIQAAAESGYVIIHVLRGDNTLWFVNTHWPRSINPPEDPYMVFRSNPVAPPANIRYLTTAFVSQSEGRVLVATNASNQQFLLRNSTWEPLTTNLPYVAGCPTIGANMGLVGSATSLTIIPFIRPISPPSIPTNYGQLMRATTSPPFEGLGRSTPLAMGSADGWAIVTASSSQCGGVTPCILRSQLNFSSFGAWAPFWTGNDPDYASPISIQDGRSMRGARGEIWMTYGSHRLAFWAP